MVGSSQTRVSSNPSYNSLCCHLLEDLVKSVSLILSFLKHSIWIIVLTTQSSYED
jgi:hypothetical protein